MKSCLILLACCLLTGTKPLMSQNFSSVDEIMKQYEGEVPGASLMIIKDGKKILTRSYGYANLEKKERVSSRHNFRLASVTKQFTATAILQLVHRGKLSLQHKLTEIFPGFPAYGKVITVQHLLTHTSGIADYEDYVSDTAMHPQIMDKGVLDIVMKLDTVYFAPGEKYRYSNTAYALLALMVEKYSGLGFDDYLQKNIFRPLGMKQSLAFVPGDNEVKYRAYGYTQKDGRWKLKDQSSTSAVLGDGGIYSSVEDLYKWDQSLYLDKILPTELKQAAFSYHRLNNGDTVHYGFGWHLKKSPKGQQVIYHTGSTSSFRNIIYRIPAENTTIIILTNRNFPVEEDMVGLAERILIAV
ncbi:serine hydrolase domain-containing protein [Flavihumibacter stibioxidans]|uniref:Penicillin-binding protein E n=1 Tax=Flavihumibacter stibioxidans TaxID=1834163 RepID=A0ABR7M8L3_9BACT|nr:serine hydrolase domain-containing protein [Flavihumibacter stibioxidans]MBC6491356.1 penicillin-binding protein E [Flavihumibacter stibioxidans]